MYIPKRYGESKTNKCPFCDRDAFFQNSQKIPTCKDHKNKTLENLKCICGSWLDMREGKYGIFFTCINCGALNIKKVLEMNSIQKSAVPYKIQQKGTVEEQIGIEEKNIKKEYKERETKPKQKPKTLQEIEQEMRKGNEQVIRSDELDFF